MVKVIASYVNPEGIVTPINTNGTLIVYEKRMGSWQVKKTKEYFMETIINMRQLREAMANFIEVMEDCKTFIGYEVIGVPYFELEKAGVAIWEFEGRPYEFLEYVYQQEQIEVDESSLLELEKQQQLEAVGPKDLGNGHLQVFLHLVQGSNLGLTSKQIVMPLLKDKPFYQLDIFCSHLPPWLEGEILTRNLSSTIEKISDKEIKVTIIKKCV